MWSTGHVIKTGLGYATSCTLPRPAHVGVESGHSSVEQILTTIEDEDDILVVKPTQLRKTCTIVLDSGASSDVVGLEMCDRVLRRLYPSYL